MKAYTYTPDGDGKGKEGEIPANLADAAQKAHEALVEMVAEGKDDLMEEYFDEGTLPVEHIIDGLEPASAKSAFSRFCAPPACTTSARTRSWTSSWRTCPRPRSGTSSGATEKIAENGPSAFVFKTTADPFAGRITYFKVIGGDVKNDANVHNLTRSRPSGWPTRPRPWARPAARHRTKRRRHRRGRQTEGHLDRRYAGGQGRATSSIRRSSCRSRRSPSPSKPSRATTKTAWATASTTSWKRTSPCVSTATPRPGVPARRRRPAACRRSWSAG